jgi:hypothetical protein
MASLSLEQAGEFFRRFFRMGGTFAMVKRLLADDALMERWIGFLSDSPELKLVHGVYNPAPDIYESFKTRCTEKDIDVAQFRWKGPEQAPDFDPNDPETVVVLDVTLDTLQSTFEFAWEWIKDGQESDWRWDGLSTDADKLRLLEGSDAFESYTLRWRRIKLNTNVGKKPIDVRSVQTSPGLALLFVAAQHPARVKAMDYEKRFGWFVPGIECTAPDDELWQCVPYVGFGQDDRQVELSARWYDDGNGDLSVPVFRE